MVAGRDPGGWALRAVKLLQETGFSAAAVVDIVTWAVLYPSSVRNSNTHVLLNPTSYHMHIINSVALLADFILTDSRFDPWDGWVVAIWPLWYGFFHVCWTGTGHDAVYFFLNMDSYLILAVMPGLLLAHLLIFYVLCGCGYLCKRCRPQERGR